MLNLQELRARLGTQNKSEKDYTLKRAREQFAKRKDLTKVLAIAAVCDIAGLKEGSYDEGFRIHAGFGWTIYIDLKVEGFLEAHDKRLADLLSGITAAAPGLEWSSTDYPDQKRRYFRIWSEELSVEVDAQLKDDSQKCRRVVVGKKVEERDIFQFVCDGEEVAT